MEEYEVRDVGRRAESPDLYVNLSVCDIETGASVRLQPTIGNRSAEPVLYATCRLYVDEGLGVVLRPSLKWSVIEKTTLLFNNKETATYQTIRYSWSVPDHHPILEGEE